MNERQDSEFARTDEMDSKTRRTLKSFGYEWTTFDKIQPEDEIFWERYFRDVSWSGLRGALALDAGCGKGRFSYFTAPLVSHLVALDGSDAVTAAARNLQEFPNVSLAKGDVRILPFDNQSFDFVCCLGVLHHLTEPRRGFEELVRVLAPRGHLLLYVYSRPDHDGIRAMGLKIATVMRGVTTRLPHPLLKVLSLPIALCLYLLVVLPGRLGEILNQSRISSLPLATYRGRPIRSLHLDTFDRLSAPIENRYVWGDIEPWFRDAGLVVETVREDAGLIVLARSPK